MKKLSMVWSESAIKLAELFEEVGMLTEKVKPIGIDHQVGFCREHVDEFGEEIR